MVLIFQIGILLFTFILLSHNAGCYINHLLILTSSTPSNTSVTEICMADAQHNLSLKSTILTQ